MRTFTAILAAALALAVIGCKKDEAGSSTVPTNATTTAGPSTSPTASPSESPSAPTSAGDNSKVVGTWKPDVNSLKITVADKTAKGQEQEKMQTEQAKKSMASATITFNADGSFSSTDSSGKKDGGKYTVSGNKITMSEPNTSTPEPSLTLSPDGSKISMHMEGGGNTFDVDLVKA